MDKALCGGRPREEGNLDQEQVPVGFIPWDNTDEKVKAAKHSALLFEAIGNDDLVAMARAIAFGASISDPGTDGQTPLQLANARKHEFAAELLFLYGAKKA